MGRILHHRDSSSAVGDASFADHLIPKHSRGNNRLHEDTTERRFFFAKSHDEDEKIPQLAQTNITRRSSLGTVLNAGASAVATPTSSPDEEAAKHSGLFPFELPQEFPLTRTVSTSTDLNQTSDSELNYCGIFMKGHGGQKPNGGGNSSSATPRKGTDGASARTKAVVTATATKGILKGQTSGGGCGSSKAASTSDGGGNQKKTKNTAPVRRSEELLTYTRCGSNSQ